MTTENFDPWGDIAPPDQATAVSSKRVDPDMRWDVFWGIDADRNRLLILRYGRLAASKAKLPHLKGLEIDRRSLGSGGEAYLILKLLDPELKDIFFRLCRDIVDAVRASSEENEAVASFIARTWRWHRMLKGGGRGILSSEEQKGLLGELALLRRFLLPEMQPLEAVRAWMGPLASPKDFEIGRLAIECKARRGAGRPYVAISSEHQLDTSGVDRLFLSVIEITSTSADNSNGVTLTEFAGALLKELESMDPSSLEPYEERLAMVGFDWADDYSDYRWLLGPERAFEVREDFPRVGPADLRPGVENVRYAVALHHCDDFHVDTDVMLSRIREEKQGDKH